MPIMSQLKSSEQYCEPRVYNIVGKKNMVSNNKAMMEQKAQMGGMYSNNVQQKMVKMAKSKKMNLE